MMKISSKTLRKATSIPVFLIGIFFCLVGTADTLPQWSEEAHLGVATCASGVCHGSFRERTTTRIPQNEYVLWSKRDRHSNAYNLLLNEESRWIASNLGLENAHEAGICLDCHADNIAESKRGNRFQISDGVGCEACHGGAENYLSSHTNPEQSHQDNIDQGLYPTDRLKERAALCFSCHIGNEQKIASHEIMGAGHPRLSFELDTFGVLQPAHYVVDDDYKVEKWHESSTTIWALGQIETARQMLRLLETHLDKQQRFPELSLFDCHACHHPMSDLQWAGQERIPLPPGTVRLNDAPFVMLFPIVRAVAPGLELNLEAGIKALHTSVTHNTDIAGPVSSLRTTLNQLTELADGVGSASPAVLKDILEMGAKGFFRDYVAAEQAVMAIDMLLSATEQRKSNEAWLDALYVAVEDEDRYDAFDFAARLGKQTP